MSTLPLHLALVSESDDVDMKEILKVSAALQKQVTRDFLPIWEVTATVDAFASLDDVPLDYWPMIVRDDIGYDAAGIHLDKNGQPFALISSSPDNDIWSLTASHETLEMLADPFGDRLVAGDSPKTDQGRVLFLVEVCDPSEAPQFAYSVNGVLVSDFYTPHFFDPVKSQGVRYSFTNAIKEPRDVLRGGYLSWLHPETNEWWQETWFDGAQSEFVNLGELTAAAGGYRAQLDRVTEERRIRVLSAGRKAASAAGITVAQAAPARNGRASALREQIDAIVGSQTGSKRSSSRRAAATAGSPRRSGATTAHRRRAGRVAE
jgi:hypothetical protein